MEQTITPLRCKIRCKFWVPIPDVFDPKDEGAILAALPADHPLKIALTGGGSVLLESKSGANLVPVRKVGLRSLNIVPSSLCDAEAATHGLAIRLPDDLARLIHAWEACHEGVDYKWEPFFNFYLDDLGKESGRRLRRLLAARINGISGQVVTDARCQRGEVLVSAKAAEKLLPTVRKQYPELEITSTQQMDGLRVVLQRFPVLGKKGCRWVTLRVVTDRPSLLVYVNAVDWNKLHRGDEDGDLGYIGIPRGSDKVKVVTVARIAAWPRFSLKNHEPVVDDLLAAWTEKGNAAKVETVVNFFTKDCIGPQTYMINCLARAAGFEYARSLARAVDRTEALGKITRGTFKANEPMAELVFDGRKTEGALGKFLGVVDTFQEAVAGRPFGAEPFHDFLENDEQRGLLAYAIELAGGSLRSCRSTAYGTIIAAGRKISGMVWDRRAKKLVPRAGQIIDRLLTMGIQPVDLLDRLMDCALGVRFIELPRRDNTWLKGQVEDVTEDMDAEPEEGEATGAEEEAPGQLLLPARVRGIREVLASVQCHGVPVFSGSTIEKREEGDLLVRARLREAWKRGDQRTWLVEFALPDPGASSDLTPDGHKRVELAGIEPRLFLPRLVWTGKNVELQRFDSFLADILAQAVSKVGNRTGTLEPQEVAEELDLQLRRLLNGLPAYSAAELPVRMAEFEVIFPAVEEMKADWAQKEAALTVLAEHGYDVTTTSKNAPGTIVTRSWKRGIPRYLFAVNPLIPCLDLKRRPEGRERRLALPLFAPQPPSVRSRGSSLPPVMQSSQTELVCVVGDVPGYNLFVDGEEGFGHDTLLCTAAAVEKLAMARWEFSCASQEEVGDLTGRLLEAGVGIDAIEVERNLNLLGEGLSLDTFRVHVAAKITDHGKVKACVGPFKGVMNPLPHRLFALNPDGTRTEIDVVLPATTVRKKKALDALLYILAAKAGVAEVDPECDPAALLAEIRVGLRQTWAGKKAPSEKQLHRLLNGMQPILVVNPDGTEDVVGHAVVGVLPFYRPVQTGFSQFKLRTGEGGIKVQTHAMLMAGGIGYAVPQRLKEEFADIVTVRRTTRWIQSQQELLCEVDEEFEMPADV